MQHCYLCDITPGQKCAVQRLLVQGDMRRRLLDMGLVPDTIVECVGRSPLGDPKAYLVRGAVVAIRSSDTRDILIRPAEVEE